MSAPALHVLKEKVHVEEWVEANRAQFKPPVCNKMMSNGQLKIMFVGGPNTRKDYHLDEGEEFFYMIKGDMCLKIVEKGRKKDVVIKEGEVFLLPVRVHHSPQRLADSVGLVIERERYADELDGLRYFVDDDSTEVLYEKWFHCVDLGTQLKPLIAGYFDSEQYKTRRPKPADIRDPPPMDIDNEVEVTAPVSLQGWIDSHDAELRSAGRADLFSGGETTVTVFRGRAAAAAAAATAVAQGPEQLRWDLGETWLWQLKGAATLSLGDKVVELGERDCFVVPAGQPYTVVREEGVVGLSVIMDPRKRKAKGWEPKRNA